MTTGRTVASRYKLLTVIGRGPHGVVWSVRDEGTGQRLALKLLEPRVVEAPGVLERFRRERGVLTAFLTPAFVRVLEVVDEESSLGLVSERVPGEDLRRWLERPDPVARDPITIARTLAEALAEAHAAGVVHCGVKPSNILLTEAGGPVRLSDCRIARLARGSSSDRANDAYTPPETRDGGAPVPAGDVYALGVVLRELVARTQPAHKRLPDVIAACLDPDPGGRPTAERLAEALGAITSTPAPEPATVSAAIAASAPPLTPPAPPMTTPARPAAPSISVESAHPRRARRRTRAFAVASVVAAVVVSGALAVLLRAAQATGGERETALGDPTPASASTRAITPDPSPPDSGASQDVSPGGATTVESAAGFVHEWFGSLNLAVGSGQTAALAGLNDPSCALCDDAVQAIVAGYKDGGSLRGGIYSVREVAVDSFFTAERPSLHVVFDRTPRSAVSANGQVIEVLPGAAFLTCHVILSHTGNGWRVVEVLATSRVI